CCQRFVADEFLGTEAPSLRHSEPGRPALRIPRKFCHPLTVELTFQKFVRWVHRLLRSRSDSHAAFEAGSTTSSSERPHFGQVEILSPYGVRNGGIIIASSISTLHAEQ